MTSVNHTRNMQRLDAMIGMILISVMSSQERKDGSTNIMVNGESRRI